MNTEDQARALLAGAAELPDAIQPPVGRLIGQGRRKRARRTAYTLTAVAAVAAAVFALPSAIRALAPGGPVPSAPSSLSGLFPAHAVPVSPGPSAAQLAHFHWSTLPPSPLGPRSQPLLAWTGKELLELGGTGKGSIWYNGAAYNPATGKWRLVPRPDGNVGFSNAVDVWTGRQLFVTNGQVEACGWVIEWCSPQRAGLYDPATNQWQVTELPRRMDGLAPQAAVWTGRVVILAETNTSVRHARLGVAAYNPATDRWRMITPPLPTDHPPVGVAMVVTPGRILLWSLWSRSVQNSPTSGTVYSGLDVLSLGRHGGWTTVTGGWPQHKVVEGPVYGGGQILIPPGQIWCGTCSHPAADFPAQLVDPATLARTTVPDGPLVAHPLFQPPIWLWNGRAALAANTLSPAKYVPNGPADWLSKMATYDPKTEAWTTLPVPAGQQIIAANPLWADRDLLLLMSSGALLSFHR
jgi:hypothetical protein